MVLVHFLLPVAVVCFCYLHIWVLVLRRPQEGQGGEQAAPGGRSRAGFLSMFVVFVIFAICWAPLNCIGLAKRIPRRSGSPDPRGVVCL